MGKFQFKLNITFADLSLREGLGRARSQEESESPEREDRKEDLKVLMKTNSTSSKIVFRAMSVFHGFRGHIVISTKTQIPNHWENSFPWLPKERITLMSDFTLSKF